MGGALHRRLSGFGAPGPFSYPLGEHLQVHRPSSLHLLQVFNLTNNHIVREFRAYPSGITQDRGGSSGTDALGSCV